MKRATVVIWLLFMAIAVTYTILEFATGNGTRAISRMGAIMGLVAFASVGLLVRLKRAENVLGWIFLLGAFGGMLAGLFGDLGEYIHRTTHHWTPTATWGLVIATPLFAASLAALVTFSVLLFPDGHPSSRLWRTVAWIAGVSIVVLAVGLTLTPGTLEDVKGNPANPIGVAGANALNGAFILVFAAIIGGIASIFVRFRRSRGAEREQFKWFFLGGFAFLACFAFWFSLESFIPAMLGAVVFGIGLASLPAGIAFAILRYRLYDIDRIISRTLSYGLVTGVLAGAYVGFVVLFQSISRPFTGSSDIAVAASTLIVAAAFVPVRRRVQSIVDRRFNRARYDAARTIEAFTSRLREEIDIDALGAELSTVVRRTMEPSHVTVWLRGNVPR